MITVNLRPGQRRKRPGSPFKGMLASFRDLGTKVKDPVLLLAVGAWVCVIGFLGFVYLNNVRQLYSLEPRLEQARSENRRFKTFLADKRHQEKIRDSLLAQITVIRNVDGDRYVWPHLLDEVTKALPAYTWLVDLGGAAAPAPAASAPTVKGTKADSLADTVPPALSFQLNWPDHRHPGIHPVSPAARSVSLDRECDPGVGSDNCGKGAPRHGVLHPRNVRPGRLGLHSHSSL